MESEGRTRARALLKIAAATFAPVYLFVVAVAFATTGVPLQGPPTAWYAAVVPPLYAIVCALWAFGVLEGRAPRPAIWILHLLVLPALVYSFLGLGLILPLLAALWWAAAGKPPLLA